MIKWLMRKRNWDGVPVEFFGAQDGWHTFRNRYGGLVQARWHAAEGLWALAYDRTRALTPAYMQRHYDRVV